MLNLCLVGTGLIATQHMKAFLALGGVVPLWVVSGTQEEAHKFGRIWGFARIAAELDEALADPAVDFVLIASPTSEHARQAIRSLRAGRHVIVEIPAALNLAEAREVERVSREVGRRVLVCHTMRSYPGIREIRRRVLADEFHISQIVGYFAIPRRRNQSIAGIRTWIDNLLWHHGCHMVDTAVWLLGVREVEQVNALIGKSHPEFGMAVDVSVSFRTRINQLVTIALTYNTEQFCQEVRCLGDEDTLTFRNGDLFDEKDQAVLPHRSWIDLIDQDMQMLATLTGGAPSDYEIGQVLPCMEILDRAEASAQHDCGKDEASE
jgi:2-hydroxy-4-carboxymuconate semialdehyde hemiacetal dehydrogenase